MAVTYKFRSGSQFESNGAEFLSAPISENDVPTEVLTLLDDSKRRITKVILIHEDLNAPPSSTTRQHHYWMYEKFQS